MVELITLLGSWQDLKEWLEVQTHCIIELEGTSLSEKTFMTSENCIALHIPTYHWDKKNTNSVTQQIYMINVKIYIQPTNKLTN